MKQLISSFISLCLLLQFVHPIEPNSDQLSNAKSKHQNSEPFHKNVNKHANEIKKDIHIGKKAIRKVERSLKLSKNREMNARVQRISRNLIKVVNSHQPIVLWGDKKLNPFPYVVKVIQGNEVNAFSLPGGFVYIYEGLIKFAETDDEIAAVLSHEFAHVALRHGHALEEKQSKVNMWHLLLTALSLGTGGAGALATLQAGNLLSKALASGWSIQAEKAADAAGIEYLTKSPYHPIAMLTFHERLSKNG